MSLDASGPPQGWPGATQLPASGTADALTFVQAIDAQLSAAPRQAAGSEVESEQLPADTALAPYVTLTADTPAFAAGGPTTSVVEPNVNTSEVDDTQSAAAIKLAADAQPAEAAQSVVGAPAASQPPDPRRTAAAKPADGGQPSVGGWPGPEAQFATHVPLVVYAQLAAAARQRDAAVSPASEFPADGSNGEPIDDAGWRPAMPSSADPEPVLDGSLR